MSEAVKPQENGAVRELASRIYVQLVPRVVPETMAAETPPAALVAAQLSWRLSEAFFEAEETLKAARVPKSTFKMETMNLAEWTK